MEKNIFLKNRSYRSFTEEKIEKADILAMIENARLAPSARNAQNIRFAIVQTDEKCKEIFTYIKWAGAIEWEPTSNEAPTTYIALCVPKDKNLNMNFNYFDMGVICQNILLTATSLKYGGCILGSFNKLKVAEILEVPENYNCEILIALGKPAERVSIVDAVDKNIVYYRDIEKHHHFVPKIPLNELIF